MTILIFTALACAGDVSLLLRSWRHRSVLSGLCATISLAALVVTITRARHGSTTEFTGVVIALIVLLIGAVLHGLGQAIWKLLDDEPATRR